MLIDRLWPRGLGRKEAAIDAWARELAPSSALRKWFKKRHAGELRENSDRPEWLSAAARHRPVTLAYGSREERYNNAAALKDLLERRSRRLPGRPTDGEKAA